MSKKSELWDIDADVNVTFTRVLFKEEVTKEEAIERFKENNFIQYEEMVENGMLKVTDAEIY